MMDTRERDSWLLLGLTPGLGATLTRRCVEALSSASNVIEASADQLAMIEGVGVRRAADVRREMTALANSDALKREIEHVERLGVTLLPHGSPAYPRLLSMIPDPPAVLYTRGELLDTDAVAIGIVGSRKCTHYGREQASKFAAACSQAGLCIVSGGAYGVDISAHESTLRVGGRTLAVIGSGLADPYPRDHIPVFDRIVDGHGAVLSELPMTSPPVPKNFPARNRIISGLSLGILLVEAAERSGALITARMCNEDHNREVMAIPGSVDSPTSAGCHKVIREGWATLVTNVTDVLDALRETGGELQKAGILAAAPPTEQPIQQDLFASLQSPAQQKILAALESPQTLDQLAVATTLPIGALQSDLMMLQIRGMLRKEGPVFVRRG